MREVKDPALLAQLEAGGTEVTDPQLLRQLEGGGATPDYEGWGEYGRDLARTAAQGVTLNYGDEITAGVRSMLPASLGGADYDTAVGEERSAIDRFLEHNPVAGYGSQLATGLALPGAALARGATLARTLGRSAVLGGGYGATAGIGAGEGSLDERLASGLAGGAAGTALGAALPGAGRLLGAAGRRVHGRMSPALARWQANRKAFLRRQGIEASADGGIPPTAGADAAAEQVIANQLSRAGRSADDLRRQLGEADTARRFYSGSYAQDALTLADMDPSLQRLAGSAARASPEAANYAGAVMAGRQTGVTPPGGIPEAGIPTRPALAKPGRKDPPMGQRQRLLDAMRRAFTIKDSEFHGHGKNAYRTDKQILETARKKADTLYGEARALAKGYKLRAHIEPVVNAWAARVAEAPEAEANLIRKALRKFTTGNRQLVDSLQAFDAAKRTLDDQIEGAVRSGSSNAVRTLTQIKNDLLAAVDGIEANGIGEKYAQARGVFGSHMEARNALQLGRDVFKEEADVAVDAFRDLGSEGERKLFRLGMLAGAAKRMGGKEGRDHTQLFQEPRIQEIMREVIPRTKTKTGQAKASTVFKDRPVRFGRYVQNEQRMIDTRNVVRGGSPTQRNIVDDAAFENMTELEGAFQRFKSSGSILNISLQVVETALNKIFGMKADTAASIAKHLFNADPRTRARMLAAIEQRMGVNRFEQFSQLMTRYQQMIVPSGAVSVGSATGATQ